MEAEATKLMPSKRPSVQFVSMRQLWALPGPLEIGVPAHLVEKVGIANTVSLFLVLGVESALCQIPFPCALGSVTSGMWISDFGIVANWFVDVLAVGPPIADAPKVLRRTSWKHRSDVWETSSERSSDRQNCDLSLPARDVGTLGSSRS